MQNSFEMKVQGIDRTLADKVFAVCDYYLQGKVAKHSRHLYDIYKLLPLVPQDENFRELVKEVWAVRAQSVICPSALPEANVPELLEKIIKEKAYKQDYDSLTTQLLEENVPYDTVIAALKRIADSSLFENNWKLRNQPQDFPWSPVADPFICITDTLLPKNKKVRFLGNSIFSLYTKWERFHLQPAAKNASIAN